MARNVRLEYAGAFYHVMARGNRRLPTFWDDEDRRAWLAALAEACGRTGWRVHAWVLLNNHYRSANINSATQSSNVGRCQKMLTDPYSALLCDGRRQGRA